MELVLGRTSKAKSTAKGNHPWKCSSFPTKFPWRSPVMNPGATNQPRGRLKNCAYPEISSHQWSLPE